MSAVGRPPTPTNLRVLRGNPSGRPLPTNEPRPRRRQRIPSPPESLGDVGAKEWRRLGPQLIELGLLTDLDLSAFHLYCSTYERWVKATLEADKAPVIVTPNGHVQQNPYVGLANRLFYMVNQSLARFGLDPASRSRIVVDPNDQRGDNSDLREWLFGNTGGRE